jgi:hypothetical protein
MSVILPDTPTGNPESEADERKRLLAEMKEMDEVDMSEGFTTGFEEESPVGQQRTLIPPAKPLEVNPEATATETPPLMVDGGGDVTAHIGGSGQPSTVVSAAATHPKIRETQEEERARLLGDLSEGDPRDEIPLTFTNAVQTLNAGIADILDLPGDVAAGLVNLIGRHLGFAELPSGGFRQIMENISSEGVTTTLPEGKLPTGAASTAIRFIGQNIALLPVSAMGQFIKEAEQLLQIGGKGKGLKELLRNQQAGSPEDFVQGLKDIIKMSGRGAKETARNIGLTAVNSPKLFTATEIVSSGGAGLGFGFAKENTDDPTFQFLAGTVGGLIPSVTLALLNSFGFQGIRLLNDARLSFTKAKADPRAAERIKRDFIDEDDVDNFDDDKLLPSFKARQTPAQDSGNIGLLAIEAAIYKSGDVSATMKAEGNLQLAELNEIITKSMTQGSGVEDAPFLATLKELRTQQGYYETLWQQRVAVAHARAKKRIKELGPKTNKERTNTIVREELESALEDAIATQKQLWDRVDKTRKISTLPLKEAWMKMLQSMTRLSDAGDLTFSTSKGTDDLIKELGFMSFTTKGKGFTVNKEAGVFTPGRMADEEPIAVLQDLRSRLLEELRRKLDKEPSDNKKRIFKKLQMTIIGMFKNVERDIIRLNPDGTFSVEDQRLLNAISFSREMNVTFNRGPVGQLLKKNTDGSWSVEPTLTLVKMLGSGVSPEQAKVNMKAMFKAVARETRAVDKAKRLGMDDDPVHLRPTTEAVTAYIKHTLVENFVDEHGRVNTHALNKWMKKNRENLKMLPGLKDEIKRAIEADDAYSLISGEVDSLRTIMYNKEGAAAARFIEQVPAKIFNSTIDDTSPDIVAKKMRELLHKTKKDPSGEATLGFQQSVFDWILGRSLIKGQDNADALGKSFFSGWEMEQLINKSQTQAIIKTVLTKQQQNRLELVLNSAKKLDVIRRVNPSAEGIISDAPGWILEFLGSVSGAQIGRVVAGKLGGGTVQTPHAFANRMRVFLKSLTKDHARIALVEAFTSPNPDRLKALLMLPRTTDQLGYQHKHLNAWMVELMARYNIEIEDEE